MLYLTTRNKTDSYTAHRVLHGGSPCAGGCYVPMLIPQFSEQQFEKMKDKPFSSVVADILNLFFSTKINGWDIDFAVGRKAFKIANLSHRVFVLETWHNPEGTHNYTVKCLHHLLCGESNMYLRPNDWFYTAVDIAMLFGVYSNLMKIGITEFNVALPAGDLKLLAAVRYAQKMGLPISLVALGADEREDLWEFIYHGNYSTKRDSLPAGLELMIYLAFGCEAVRDYLRIAECGRIYRLSENELAVFADSIFMAVVGSNRIQNMVSNVKRSCNYKISTDAACAYSALQDCRVHGAGNQDAVLFSYIKPIE